jgi:hypothetical protein
MSRANRYEAAAKARASIARAVILIAGLVAAVDRPLDPALSATCSAASLHRNSIDQIRLGTPGALTRCTDMRRRSMKLKR